MKRRWVVDKNDRRAGCSELSKTGLSAVACALLRSRGISTVEEAERFLRPEKNKPHDPWQMPDMKGAIDKIEYCIENNRSIFIYGDYDADGVTSTSILYLCLRKLGADVHYYIPNRMDEGYGLSAEAIDRVISYGARLIVTVDCGISSMHEVSYCKGSGADIIITDHHECRDEIPDTLVVSAKRADSRYPFSGLSGAGVALKVAQCLSLLHDEIDPDDYIELAAIGTIADVVPLTDENRLIVKRGLKMMKSSASPGIRALMKVSGIDPLNLNSEQVAFFMAPRINAAGRIADASEGVKLFTCADESEALTLAEEMNGYNVKRQQIEEKIISEAEQTIGAGETADSVIILKSPGWHIGVIGIVASKLVDKYNRPAMVFSDEDGLCRGSGRSIHGFNLFRALAECSDLLVRYGGHELAAGATVKEENFAEFKLRMNMIAREKMPHSAAAPLLNIDCEIDEGDIGLQLLDEIEMMEPFGMGNPAPLFVCRSAIIDGIKAVGKQRQHLSLMLSMGHKTFKAIGFNMGYNINGYAKNSCVDAACSLERERWGGIESIKLVLKDLRPSRICAIGDEYYRSLKNIIDCVADGAEFDVQYTGGLIRDTESYADVIESTEGNPGCAILASRLDIVEDILDCNTDHDVLLRNNRMSDGSKPVIIINPDVCTIDFTKIEDVYGSACELLLCKHCGAMRMRSRIRASLLR